MKVNHGQFRWWCSYWPELRWCCYLSYTSTEVTHSIWVFKLHFPLPFPSRKNEVDHSLLIFFPKYWYQESVFCCDDKYQIETIQKEETFCFMVSEVTVEGQLPSLFLGQWWGSISWLKGILEESCPSSGWPRNSRQSCTLEQNRVPKEKVLGKYFLQLEPTSKSFHKIMNLLLD